MTIAAISWPYSVDYPLEDGGSLSSSMMHTFEERHDILETELRAENDSMQARNDLLKDMNSVLATLRANRPNDEKTRNSYGTFTNSHGQSMDVYKWMQKNNILPATAHRETDVKKLTSELERAGIHVTHLHVKNPFGLPVDNPGESGVSGSQSEFDTAINNVKAGIDSANSEGQMETIHFQDIYGKFNHEAELMSNCLSKDQKTSDLIIANIR